MTQDYFLLPIFNSLRNKVAKYLQLQSPLKNTWKPENYDPKLAKITAKIREASE